jgi:hypothetical protein
VDNDDDDANADVEAGEHVCDFLEVWLHQL